MKQSGIPSQSCNFPLSTKKKPYLPESNMIQGQTGKSAFLSPKPQFSVPQSEVYHTAICPPSISSSQIQYTQTENHSVLIYGLIENHLREIQQIFSSLGRNKGFKLRGNTMEIEYLDAMTKNQALSMNRMRLPSDPNVVIGVLNKQKIGYMQVEQQDTKNRRPVGLRAEEQQNLRAQYPNIFILENNHKTAWWFLKKFVQVLTNTEW